jgi:predicted dehydrogenase
MNKTTTSRRRFLLQSASVGASISLFTRSTRLGAAEAPSNKLRVAVMGLGRGYDHVKALLQISGVEIAWVCDVDEQRLDRGAKAVAGAQPTAPKTAKDFRRILDDPAVDALFIATPNFWHAPATILACAAGKHVYVEKPGSHNAREGELMVAAARKYKRQVQMGNQRRSWPGIIEGMARLRDGAIGRVLAARCYYTSARTSIGRGRPIPPPAFLDYGLWQGPAPERPYVDNLVHYNWHWRWHWGGGELANNGIHCLDLARWGLGVDYPRRVTCNGGRYYYSDDQETPDTGAAVYDFGGCVAIFDQSSCSARPNEKLPLVAFFGEKGSLVEDGAGYRILDLKGTEISRGSGGGGDKIHFENFLNGIRAGARLNSEIEEAQKSTLLCHLGNIAYRTGRTIHFDPATRRIVNDPGAEELWRREYRPGWEPKV